MLTWELETYFSWERFPTAKWLQEHTARPLGLCHRRGCPVSPRSQEHADGSGWSFFSASPKPLPSPVAGPLVRHRHVDFHTIKLSLPVSTGSSLGAYEWVIKTQHLSVDTIGFVFEGTSGHELWLLNDMPGPVKYLCFLLAFVFCQQQKFVQWQMTAFFLRSSGDTGRGERARTLELEELWKQQWTFTETSPGLHLHYFL